MENIEQSPDSIGSFCTRKAKRTVDEIILSLHQSRQKKTKRLVSENKFFCSDIEERNGNCLTLPGSDFLITCVFYNFSAMSADITEKFGIRETDVAQPITWYSKTCSFCNAIENQELPLYVSTDTG